MHTISYSRLFLVNLMLALASCGSNNQRRKKEIRLQQKQHHHKKKLQAYLQNCWAIIMASQPGYFAKNKYGDDMVLNGNKISVPLCRLQSL